MKNLYILLVVAAMVLFWARCSDNKIKESETPYARFLQDAVSISSSGGNVSAIINWSGAEWEIQLDNDNGVIADISPKAGGGAGSGNTTVKFTCNENTTGEDRSQGVFLVNNVSSI